MSQHCVVADVSSPIPARHVSDARPAEDILYDIILHCGCPELDLLL